MAQSAGVTVIIGNLYSSGCSLERHWKNAESNYSAYTYLGTDIDIIIPCGTAIQNARTN
ncbi:MAG: DUF4886 domain-containing protein [Sedimentibacter sp.]